MMIQIYMHTEKKTQRQQRFPWFNYYWIRKKGSLLVGET